MGARHEAGNRAEEWEAFGGYAEFVAAVRALGLNLSERKVRLLACGVARCALNWQENSGYRVAIECGEALADGLPPPVPLATARRGLDSEGGRSIPPPEIRVALWCLATTEARRSPFVALGHGYEAAEMAVFRDIVPNPFLPLTWNPDWFTSTVRDIAAHVYAAHEFYSMPILADALQDAGCGDEQILNHCRVEKLHARGCWVLDAILGKA